MPLVRYEIRNEYSLAKPELYRSAGKDESDVLLEGVAMAGLVGILRQLGDLAQFAAEIFHDVHEEMMATAARSHGLIIRIQQLEAEVPSIEKALMAGNQVRFAHTLGSDWQASIPNHHNHLTYSELPCFIRNAYEECRGPPRLFTLDKFDIAGTGACLKRYTDPSFFKTELASSELRKAENAQRDRYTARLKKRVRRQRNSETTEVSVTSQQNSRIHCSVFDVADPRCAPGNQCYTANHILESKQRKKFPSAGMIEEDQAKDDLPMGQVTGFQSVNISGKETKERRMCCGIIQTEEKFVFVNRERKIQAEDDLGSFEDFGGEPENFVDALTTMESEIEIDSECQIKQEVNSDIISEHRETGSLAYTKSYEQPVRYSVFRDTQSLHTAKSSSGVANTKTSTPSEGSVEQSLILASVHASPQSGEKGSAVDLDSDNEANMVASSVSSECGNVVWTTDTSNMEAVHDHDNVTLLAPALETMATVKNNFFQTPDAVKNHSSSFAFSNTELSSSLGRVHVLTDCREKDSTADLDSGNNCNTVRTTYSSTEMVLDDHLYKPFAATACDVPITSTSLFQKSEAALDRSSSFAFTNFESFNGSLNATPSACFDSGDAFFRFVTPELSIMYNDAKFASSIIIEELGDSQLSFISGSSNKIKSLSVSEASKYTCNEELESSLIPSIPPDAGENELESCSDLSEFASGLHNVQGDHLYPDLEIDDVKSEMPSDCVSCDKTYPKHENPSTTLAGSISPQSEIEETFIESPIGNLHSKHSTGLCAYLFSDPMNDKALESSIDVETVGNRVLDVSSSDDVLKMKPVHMYEGSSDSSVVISTASNHRHFEFCPELQSFQVSVNYTSIPLPENREFSCDMLGEKPISRFHNSKVVGTVLENNLISDFPTKDISVDMIQAELATVGHINSDSGLTSSNNDCHERSINVFKKDETEAFVVADSPIVSCSTMSPISIFHSRSLVESANTGSNNLSSTEIKTSLLGEVHTGRIHDVPSASSAGNILLDDHPHKESVTKNSSAGLQSHGVDEQHWGYAKEGSISSLGHIDSQGHDLSSSLQDQTDISFSQPAIGSPLHLLFTRSDYYPENLSPERSSCNIRITNLSPLCLLPEPVIPLEKELEGKDTADCTSLASNNLEKSSQAIIDEMQSLKLSYTADGSEGGHQRSHVAHSSVSFSDHFVESTTESAVIPEITLSANEKLGSSRILLTSLLTNSLSSSEPRSSILMNLDDGSGEAGDNSNSFQPSPRPWTSIRLSLPASQDNNTHDVIFGTSQMMNQYESVGSEDLVSSSLITESKIPENLSQETPPPPPLPPLDWWITRPQKVSLTSIESAVPLAPPPPPSKLSWPAQNSQSQKTYIERNDSLIKSIASHDKSRLRKVIQQTQSLKAKPLTEREELLEQIRNRSFSLRPTVTKKLEIPRPATSINVTAILKKASAIRKAVGSEDDEDDDWSDA
ncbi:hypothetical protein SUGI_0177540 [Cryptomeria japonica]|uniref:uncharacterized protein LOC131066770 n=1 Tax=Cryptomeria japonica TaxID=3369 RepID=UPI002408CE6E|nr:uncharacterized protein LOC131066770 [Cryptomeria japonica]GLJ11807.1 hypothetical protein SUGI_0177540 [Cryptomeria japonica]